MPVSNVEAIVTGLASRMRVLGDTCVISARLACNNSTEHTNVFNIGLWGR